MGAKMLYNSSMEKTNKIASNEVIPISLCQVYPYKTRQYLISSSGGLH